MTAPRRGGKLSARMSKSAPLDVWSAIPFLAHVSVNVYVNVHAHVSVHVHVKYEL